MSSRARIRVIDKALCSSAGTIVPAFLVPAFYPASRARTFSATTACCSKLGRTPLSIPEGVELVIGDPKTKKDATTYMKISKRQVTVSGPLGKLDLDVPPFVKLDHDEVGRRLTLSVQDREVKQQREMWGKG
jgi:large subunit ribosomal protein L6